MNIILKLVISPISCYRQANTPKSESFWNLKTNKSQSTSQFKATTHWACLGRLLPYRRHSTDPSYTRPGNNWVCTLSASGKVEAVTRLSVHHEPWKLLCYQLRAQETQGTDLNPPNLGLLPNHPLPENLHIAWGQIHKWSLQFLVSTVKTGGKDPFSI